MVTYYLSSAVVVRAAIMSMNACGGPPPHMSVFVYVVCARAQNFECTAACADDDVKPAPPQTRTLPTNARTPGK